MTLPSQDTVMALDADFGAMAVEVGRRAWGLPGLTAREKAFVFVAADLCRGNLGFPLRTHVGMARSLGVALEDIREAVRHLAPYVGYPTAAEALMVLHDMGHDGAGRRADEPASPPGRPVGAGTAGAGPVDAGTASAGPVDREPAAVGSVDPEPAGVDAGTMDELLRLDAPFAAFLRHQFDARWHRPNLTVRERALCTLATDVLNGTLDRSFRLHVDLALGHGATPAQVSSVILLVAEYGLARAWLAFMALDRVLAAGG